MSRDLLRSAFSNPSFTLFHSFISLKCFDAPAAQISSRDVRTSCVCVEQRVLTNCSLFQCLCGERGKNPDKLSLVSLTFPLLMNLIGLPDLSLSRQSHCRPISIFSSLSKPLKKHSHTHLQTHKLIKHKILHTK